MRLLPEILLQSAELDPDFRWRLVDNLFSQYRAMIDGSLALAFLEAICAYQTGSAVFWMLLGIVALVTALRGALTWQFYRHAGPHLQRRRGRAETWARRFVAGNAATACLFGATTLTVCLGFPRPTLQLFVMLVQGAWLAGSTQRSAVSPAAVVLQTTLVSVPVIVGAALSGTALVQWVILFVVAHAFSAKSGLTYFGDLYLNTMLTEQRLARANARLTELSATDGLTGVGNRRAFDAALAAAIGSPAWDRRDVSLIMIDVDYFKRFNDTYGHPAGDDCLRLIAVVIGDAARRKGGLVCRIGGEEFAALLPGADESGARAVALGIRESLCEAALPHATSPFGRVTVSIGLTSLSSHPGATAERLLDLADAALYRAKQSGRDAVVGSQPSPARRTADVITDD